MVMITIVPNASSGHPDLAQNLKKKILEETGFAENQVKRYFSAVFPDGPLEGHCYVELQIEYDLSEEELLRRLKERRYEEIKL
ncbi:MAG TPA: hypothetical protein DCX32_00690 [Candidatus Moranbacteria bacterium]|nr:hypothetical protein [Candidatus Moranbacteria bacterium]